MKRRQARLDGLYGADHLSSSASLRSTKSSRGLQAIRDPARVFQVARGLRWAGPAVAPSESSPIRHPSMGAKECTPRNHWMTSSARASSDGGMVNPSALAVLRLNERDPWWRAAQRAIPHQPAAGRGRGRDDPRTSEPEGGSLTTGTRHDVDFWTRAIRRR